MRFPIVAALLLTATAAIYTPSLGYPLVYEDRRDNALIQASVQVGNLSNPWRTLTAATHAASRAVFGIEPWGFHLMSVGIHLVNVGLWLAVLWLVLPPWTALVGAAVFAWHPLQVEAVTYVSSRSDLLACTGLLLALLATTLGSLPGALVGVAFSVLGKETAIVAWALVPLWAWWTRAPFPVTRYLLIGFIGALVTGWALMADIQAIAFAPSLELAGNALVSIGRLTLLVFVPWGFTVDHDWASMAWLWRVALLAAVALVAWSLTEGWWERKSVALAVLWTLVALSPRLVVPLYEGLHEHHMLIPMMGWSIVIAWAVTPRTKGLSDGW